MLKYPLHQYIVWFGCIVLLNSACAQASNTTKTILPSATPVQSTIVAVIETTVPIATLTPSAEPVAEPTAQTNDAIDSLASQTKEGYYQLGSLTAPITMVDYSDFFWSVCAFHVLEVEPKLIEEYVRTGAIRIVSRPLLQSGPSSLRAAHAVACAGEQQQYFAMRSLVYANIGMLYTAPDMDVALSELAGQTTLDHGAFDECMASNRHEQALYEGFTRAKNDGIQSRPVFDINDTRIIGGRSYADFVTIFASLQP